MKKPEFKTTEIVRIPREWGVGGWGIRNYE